MSFPDKSRFHFSILQKITLGFVLAVAMMLLRSVIAYYNAADLLATADRASQSHMVLEAHTQLQRDLMEAESAERGYVITTDAGYLAAYTQASEAVAQDMTNLKTLTVSDPFWQEQSEQLKKMEPLIERKLAVMQEYIRAHQTAEDEKPPGQFAKSGDRELMAEIRESMKTFEGNEKKRLDGITHLFTQRGKLAMAMVGYGTLVAAVLLGAGMWLILRDVSARRKVEEELAEERNLLSVLIETIPHQMYVKDMEGRYVMDNAAHRKHIGVTNILEVNGTRASDYFPPDIARLYMEGDQKVMRLGEKVLDQEEPGVDRKGNLIWLSTTKMPLYDINAKVVGLVGLSEDITERKHAEERLRHYAEQMERSNKELEEFASIASHDLQEPLRKIMAFGQRLEATCGEALGEKGKDYVERMRHAAERMQTLISDLLTLSRVTSMARPFKQVDLAQIVKDVVSDLEVRIEQTGGAVEVGFLPEIEADPVQMRQLFQNLVSNALKFHRMGEKPHVAICGKILQMKDYQLPGVLPGDDACRIMVKDNGIGFSKEYAEKIFALFQRLHGRSEYEGTGIGLAVCRKITDRHGGSIVAKSSEGDGATFIVTLPLKQTQNNNHEH